MAENDMTREEYQRCCEDPAYFFSNCALVKNDDGEWVKPGPVTAKRLSGKAESAVRQKDLMRRSLAVSLMELFPNAFKGRVVLTAYAKEG